MEQFFQWNENEITIGEPHTSFQENSEVSTSPSQSGKRVIHP